jgi:Holliday junction DNA helicase RuvB
MDETPQKSPARLLAPDADSSERDGERALRPRRLGDFKGQTELKKKLEIFIEAAKKRGDSLDHVLLHGPPGLGKTSLANIISQEMGGDCKVTSGPVIERPGDLAALLTNLSPGDALFIDEIHRLSPSVEEILYPAMEERKLDLMIGQGPGARSIRLELPSFTLVGATTRAGRLTSPLRDRFGIQLRLDYYSPDELKLIVDRAAIILGRRQNHRRRVQGDSLPVQGHASRDRTPPKTSAGLRRSHDDRRTSRSRGRRPGLLMMDIDERGLDLLDRRILDILTIRYAGRWGVDAVAVGEDPDAIAEGYEPFLVQEGHIHQGRGRTATPMAYERMNRRPDTPRRNSSGTEKAGAFASPKRPKMTKNCDRYR